MSTSLEQQTVTRVQGFASQREETHVGNVPVEGALPAWLGGTLVRVTPAELEIGGVPTRHWFDGLAMLNAFTLDGANNRVGYGSRFLDSQVRRNSEQGNSDFIGFANDPCRGLFKRLVGIFDTSRVNDNCNVNLARLGNEYVAMTEVPLPMVFDPATLQTKGLHRWRDGIQGHLTTAHPCVDARTQELVNYVTFAGPRNRYRVTSVAPGTRSRRLVADIRAGREVAYMHSFGMTKHYVILTEFPLVVDPLKLAFGRTKPLIDHFEWKPERGTRFLVIDRAGGRLAKRIEGPAFFAFHHVNAFESSPTELVLDVVTHEDGPGVIDELQVEKLRDPHHKIPPSSRMHRYRLDLDERTVSDERLSDTYCELPRINDAMAQSPHRHTYVAAYRSADSEWFDALAKLSEGDDDKTWSADGCYPGEPVFVPAPDATREDDGVVLSVVLDAREGRSFLLVLDAQTFEERARAQAPHHVPFGFHGAHFA